MLLAFLEQVADLGEQLHVCGRRAAAHQPRRERANGLTMKK
jgi:hypothetical protein